MTYIRILILWGLALLVMLFIIGSSGAETISTDPLRMPSTQNSQHSLTTTDKGFNQNNTGSTITTTSTESTLPTIKVDMPYRLSCLELTTRPLPLKTGVLKRNYNAYAIDLVNKCQFVVNIASGKVLNALPEEEIAAMIETPTMTTVVHQDNYIVDITEFINAGVKRDFQTFTDKFPPEYLSFTDIVSLNVLVPKPQTPSIRLFLKDLESNEFFTVSTKK